MNIRETQPFPRAVKLLGLVMILAAALLLAGGALRRQSNMVTSGLLFLAFGILFSQGLRSRGPALTVSVVALLVVGAVLTLLV